jgi:ADP-ribosylglycohydrolase
MLGSIAGDIIGSVYEHAPIKTTDFSLFGDGCQFTDDTVCTVAIAQSLLGPFPFADSLRTLVRRHPERGYGGMFHSWATSDDLPPYGSWGNGAPMRVSPVGFMANSHAQALELAAASAAVSHDHPEAVKGAQAVAVAIWMARRGWSKTEIRSSIQTQFGYRLDRTVDSIRSAYRFDVSAAGTVPAALICALDAANFEQAVRNAVSLGGDSDTLACIAGGLAEALHGLPPSLAHAASRYLTLDLLQIVKTFYAVCPVAGATPP